MHLILLDNREEIKQKKYIKQKGNTYFTAIYVALVCFYMGLKLGIERGRSFFNLHDHFVTLLLHYFNLTPLKPHGTVRYFKMLEPLRLQMKGQIYQSCQRHS